jgi:hypothetical protein
MEPPPAAHDARPEATPPESWAAKVTIGAGKAMNRYAPMSRHNGAVTRFTQMRRTIHAMITHDSVRRGADVMFRGAHVWRSTAMR